MQDYTQDQFALLDLFRSKRTDYLHTYGSPAGQRVLIDLASFCRANETCFHPDQRLHAVAEGRREVWLRHQKFLKLTAEEQMQLYLARPARQPGD